MIGTRTILSRGERSGVWLTLALAFCVAATSVAVEARFGSGHWAGRAVAMFADVAALSFPAVGAVVVLRGGERRVGWTLLGIGVSFTVDSLAVNWADAYVKGRLVPLGPWACWLDEWVWTFLIAGVWLLFVLFPDGAPFGRSGRLLLGWIGLVTVVLLTTRPFHGGRLDDHPSVLTPVPALPGLRAWADAVDYRVILPVIVVTFVLTFASVVHRYVRSGALRRAQLRWIAWQLAVTLSVLLLQQVPPLTSALQWVSLALIPLLPAAIGLAMFRERLYDIDRVISRTVSYALLSGLLAGLYAAVVTIGSTLSPDRFGAVGVAVATLIVAALFVPARRTLQRLVDRRFDRVRFSRRRIAEEFGRTTRRDVGSGRVEADLLRAVQRTMTPAHASIWMVGTGGR